MDSSYESKFTDNPSIPPGADDSRCTPFIYGYKFDDFYKSNSNKKHYQIELPGSSKSKKNYANVICGVKDIQVRKTNFKLNFLFNVLFIYFTIYFSLNRMSLCLLV